VWSRRHSITPTANCSTAIALAAEPGRIAPLAAAALGGLYGNGEGAQLTRRWLWVGRWHKGEAMPTKSLPPLRVSRHRREAATAAELFSAATIAVVEGADPRTIARMLGSRSRSCSARALLKGSFRRGSHERRPSALTLEVRRCFGRSFSRCGDALRARPSSSLDRQGLVLSPLTH